MSESINLRYELRAYEATNACRLASILRELGSPIARDAVVARWVQRYPRHATQTGNQRIRRRLSKALGTMQVAGMVRAQGNDLVVVDPERLHLAANNLAIVEDGHGVARPPAQWPNRPAAPVHLIDVQARLQAEANGHSHDIDA